jgi:hypothetical protein
VVLSRKQVALGESNHFEDSEVSPILDGVVRAFSKHLKSILSTSQLVVSSPKSQIFTSYNIRSVVKIHTEDSFKILLFYVHYFAA